MGEVDTSQPHYFAVADGVSQRARYHALPVDVLLELLQTRLATASATVSLSALLHQVQQDYVALSAIQADCFWHGLHIGGVCVCLANQPPFFNVGDSRAYLLTGGASKPHAHLISRDHSFLNELIDDGEITHAQSENSCQFHARASRPISSLIRNLMGLR
jgi:serine/threonine protein phosphatase PrpC